MTIKAQTEGSESDSLTISVAEARSLVMTLNVVVRNEPDEWVWQDGEMELNKRLLERLEEATG